MTLWKLWINSQKKPFSEGHSQKYEKLVNFPLPASPPPVATQHQPLQVDSFRLAFLETYRSLLLVKGSSMTKDLTCDHLVQCLRRWDNCFKEAKTNLRNVLPSPAAVSSNDESRRLFLSLTSYNDPLGLG